MAGYYSYKWAEVLSADALLLEEAGLDSELVSRHWEAPVIPCWHRVVQASHGGVQVLPGSTSTEPLLRHSSLVFL